MALTGMRRVVATTVPRCHIAAWLPGAGACRGITTLIMGPPGGGKGTISKRLIKDFGFCHVSTGDMLRTNVRVGSALGQKAKSFMDAGGLVPDELIIEMVLSEVSNLQSDHVLLDGFPRTSGQAEALTKRMTVDVALNLAVPNEEIVQRMSGRWIHLASGRTYAYDFNPPKVEGKDDETGEDLVQRDDDKPESVRARLQSYDHETVPLLSYYKAQGVLAEFDGSDQPELVAANRRSDAIYASLKPFMASKL
eukprot:TRINITY_DN67446_c0_g1_i1.p1 TRINITY_DN67446_c0_g1~~TRINITY_DN67446_c0_g1_i1.p1  ORF type:complete len:265 (+),score=51.91 TRINITY_DN67446_c0_g1_i1:43-795(+)